MLKALENMNTEELKGVIKTLETQNSSLESRINEMQFHIDRMTRLLFGAKRERFIHGTDGNQESLHGDGYRTFINVIRTFLCIGNMVIVRRVLLQRAV